MIMKSCPPPHPLCILPSPSGALYSSYFVFPHILRFETPTNHKAEVEGKPCIHPCRQCLTRYLAISSLRSLARYP